MKAAMIANSHFKDRYVYSSDDARSKKFWNPYNMDISAKAAVDAREVQIDHLLTYFN